MPIVNHLSYKMKVDNEQIDDVKLIGFVKNEDDCRKTMESKFGKENGDKYWKTHGDNNDKNIRNVTSMTTGYINAAFHAAETENCHCVDRNRK